MSFEAYLKEKGIQEKDLATGVKKLESLLGRAIAFVVPNTNEDIAKGLIWQNGGINPDTSPEDVERGLTILRNAVLRKQAQGLVDQFDAEEYQTQQPSAMKFNLTGEDSEGQGGDPLDSQQIGRFQETIPESFEDEPEEMQEPTIASLDDRVCELLKISI